MTFSHEKLFYLKLLLILCFLSLRVPPSWCVPCSFFGLLFNLYLHCVQLLAPFALSDSILLEEAVSVVTIPENSPPPTLKVAVFYNSLIKLEHFCQQHLRLLQGDSLHCMQLITY